MASTLFLIEKGIKIRDQLKPLTKFLLGGADRHRPDGSVSWLLEFEPAAMIAQSDQRAFVRVS